MRPISSRYEAAENPNGMKGVGGVRVFTFKVLATGKGDLNFVHGKSWETKPKIQKGEDMGSFVKKIVPISAVKKAAAQKKE